MAPGSKGASKRERVLVETGKKAVDERPSSFATASFSSWATLSPRPDCPRGACQTADPLSPSSISSSPDAGSVTTSGNDASIASSVLTGGATVGVVCSEAGLEARIVFTEAPATCAVHATILGGSPSTGASAVLRVPELEGPTQVVADATVCVAGRCAASPFELDIHTYEREGVAGGWSTVSSSRRPRCLATVDEVAYWA